MPVSVLGGRPRVRDITLEISVCLYHIQFHGNLSRFSLKKNEIGPSYLPASTRLI